MDSSSLVDDFLNPSRFLLQAKVEDKIKALRDSVNADDTDGMKKGMEALQQEAMTMGQAMYSQPGAAGAEGAPGAPPPGGPDGSKKPGDDDVIDAEFK